MRRELLQQRERKREHEFVLVLRGVHEVTEELESALCESGCDDATICLRSGQVYLTFCREANSMKDAVDSAIRDVTKAIPLVKAMRCDE